MLRRSTRGSSERLTLRDGDHHSGASEFEDEFIKVHLKKIEEEIGYLGFTVSTKGNVRFKEVSHPECIFYDELTLNKFHSIDLKTVFEPEDSDHQVFLAGLVYRSQQGIDQWLLKPTTEFIPIDNPEIIQESLSKLL